MADHAAHLVDHVFPAVPIRRCRDPRRADYARWGGVGPDSAAAPALPVGAGPRPLPGGGCGLSARGARLAPSSGAASRCDGWPRRRRCRRAALWRGTSTRSCSTASSPGVTTDTSASMPHRSWTPPMWPTCWPRLRRGCSVSWPATAAIPRIPTAARMRSATRRRCWRGWPRRPSRGGWRLAARWVRARDGWGRRRFAGYQAPSQTSERWQFGIRFRAIRRGAAPGRT